MSCPWSIDDADVLLVEVRFFFDGLDIGGGFLMTILLRFMSKRFQWFLTRPSAFGWSPSLPVTVKDFETNQSDPDFENLAAMQLTLHFG